MKKLAVFLFAGLMIACQPELRRPVSDPIFHPQSYSGYVLFDTTGAIIDSFQANRFFIPASLTKLYFYPELKKVAGDKVFSATTWEYDPSDSTLKLAAPGNPLLTIESLRTCVASSGPVNRVILFHLPYDSIRTWGAGWMADDEPADYQAYLSPVPINLNVQTVTVAIKKDSLLLKQEPWTLPCQTKPGMKLSVTRAPSTDTLLVMIPPDSTGSVTRKLSVKNPERHLHQWLRALTQEHMLKVVPVLQLPVLKNTINHDQKSLTTLILQQSNNLAAEQILRYASLKAGGNGSVADYLKRHPVPVSDGRLVDGSGLSRYNMLTPLAIGKVIRSMMSDSTLQNHLAIYGQTGTLDDRFRLNDSTVTVLAKSGSMNSVQNLAGMIVVRGKPVAGFVLMVNFWLDSKENRYRLEKEILDRWVTLLDKNHRSTKDH